MSEPTRHDLAAVFDEHMAAEFERHDAAATMDTMTATPHLTHVPVLTGAFGRAALHDFYRDHFVTKWPADTSVERIYWDQASVLVQLGLLDPTGLPVVGAEQADGVRDPTTPRNALIARAGAEGS